MSDGTMSPEKSFNNSGWAVPEDPTSLGSGSGGKLIRPDLRRHQSQEPSNKKEPEQSLYPEWMVGRDDSIFNRESILATGFEQMRVIDLMVETGDKDKLLRSGNVGRSLSVEEMEGLSAEIKERKEKLNLYYEMAIGAGQDNVIKVADMVSRIIEPSPYMAQQEMAFFKNADRGLINLARYYRQDLPPVILPIFRTYDAALTHQQGKLHFLFAAGGASFGYFDTLLKAGSTLGNRSRYHASFEDVQSALCANDPGVTVELTDSQKREINGMFAEREPRKEQERVDDDCRAIMDATVAVMQEDLVDGCYFKTKETNGNIKEERVTIQSNISPKQKLFIQYYFGDTNKDNWVVYKATDWTGRERRLHTPKEISMWYAEGDKISTRDRWLAKMVAVLEWQKKDSNGKIDKTIEIKNRGLWRQLNNMTEDEILGLANDLNKEATKIQSLKGDKVENSRFERGAAKVALLSWLETDKPFMMAGKFAWKWKYIEVGDEVFRFKDGGGIHKSHDDINLIYPWDKYLGYKATWKSTSEFFIASSNAMRKEKYLHRPHWMPDLQKGLDKDPRMKKIWSFLVEPQYHELRAKILAGKDSDPQKQQQNLEKARKVADLDPEILEHIKNSTYAYETAYVNKDGKNIVLPMSLPKNMEFMGIWNFVRDKETGESIYEMWQRGVRPSEIDYSRFNFESLDRMWISGSMLVRMAKFWIDPYEKERDPVLAAFFNSAGTQSVSEMGKRVFLAFRDLPLDYKNMLADILPDMILLYEAHNCGIIGTDLGTPDGIEALRKWNFNVAKWKRALMWMPNIQYDEETLYKTDEEILENWDGIKNLGNDLALILSVKKLAVERVAQAQWSADKDALTRAYNGYLDLYDDPLIASVMAKEGQEADVKPSTRSVKPQQFDVISEGDIKKKYFGDKQI